MAAPELLHYSFGRPFVDKPSVEGLPEGAIGLAQTSLLAANRAAADWERVELLFERNWFGPCTCLGDSWTSELDSPDLDAAEIRPLIDSNAQPSTAAHLVRGFLCLLWSPRSQWAIKSQPAGQPELVTNTGQSALYGVAAAPIPEPAFNSNVVKGTSPPRALPVPKRVAGSANETGGDGPLPPALAMDPPTAAPVPTPAEPLAAQLPMVSLDDTAQHGVLGPQLGTWADRQYRLLDAVPERGECGPGSASANSIPTPPSNNRSPNTPVALGHHTERRVGGFNGSGSGVCGSNSGGCSGGGPGSSSILASSQGHGPSSVFQDSSLHKQKQGHGQAQGQGEGYLGWDGTGRLADGSRQQQPTAAVNIGSNLPLPTDRNGTMQHQQTSAPINAARQQVDVEAMIQEAAWRWRFTRRWQAEQARTDPEQASSAPHDHTEEALAYLQATNATTTVSMQIANVGNRRGGGGSHGGMSMDGSLTATGMACTLGAAASTLGGDWPLGACGSGSGSGSFTSGPRILARQASGEMLAASREIAQMNRRAAAVLQQQLDCEQQADRRVQESLGQGLPWVGQFIPMVQIDEWGSFRFLMIKLRDPSTRGGGAPGSERQRILIRGHNYGSEGQLMEECSREILAAAQKHALPFEAPSCMGGGVMEWRRDRDRHLHLHSGFVMDRALPLTVGGGSGMFPSSGSRPASAMDLLNLAAALARQTFPPTYKITVLA